jgi:hypothetical protein
MTTTNEQAIARLMGADLYVWNACQRYGLNIGDGLYGYGTGDGCGFGPTPPGDDEEGDSTGDGNYRSRGDGFFPDDGLRSYGDGSWGIYNYGDGHGDGGSNKP